MNHSEIQNLRLKGYGYKKIAAILNLQENSVKSFCRRHPLKTNEKFCLQCGTPIENTPHKREKKFCSDSCRMKWWNSHPEKVNRKSFTKSTCEFCGISFTSYGKHSRRFCSRSCYAKSRSKEIVVNG